MSSSPTASTKSANVWHVLIFLGVVVLLVDTAATRMMSTKTEQVVRYEHVPTPAPAQQPPVVPVEPRPMEKVEVLVAAKDLPVGTLFTREDLAKVVKTAKLPKGALPLAFVANAEELLDKRLTRSIRQGETFNWQDLSKGGVITLPEGYDMVSIQVTPGQAAAGFIVPGSRVDVLATLRTGDKMQAFPLLVNVLVVAVDTRTIVKCEPFPDMNIVSFAVTQKQALLLDLAKSRGCNLSLLLRNPNKTDEADKNYNIDEVIKLLSQQKDKLAPVEGREERPLPEGEKP
jgi:pilus assembly protein CpaB